MARSIMAVSLRSGERPRARAALPVRDRTPDLCQDKGTVFCRSDHSPETISAVLGMAGAGDQRTRRSSSQRGPAREGPGPAGGGTHGNQSERATCMLHLSSTQDANPSTELGSNLGK